MSKNDLILLDFIKPFAVLEFHICSFQSGKILFVLSLCVLKNVLRIVYIVK